MVESVGRENAEMFQYLWGKCIDLPPYELPVCPIVVQVRFIDCGFDDHAIVIAKVIGRPELDFDIPYAQHHLSNVFDHLFEFRLPA